MVMLGIPSRALAVVMSLKNSITKGPGNGHCLADSLAGSLLVSQLIQSVHQASLEGIEERELNKSSE